ncbi:MAG TPA: hypothetical protein VHS28_04725 [Chloroflexota bacterium]|nr:hypothetical protein [Chloroflexota bacterium]
MGKQFCENPDRAARGDGADVDSGRDYSQAHLDEGSVPGARRALTITQGRIIHAPHPTQTATWGSCWPAGLPGRHSGNELYRLEPMCLRAYGEGMADAGADVTLSTVRRGHAASMAIFAGLQAIPAERLAEPDSEEFGALITGRMETVRFLLDLLASTD